MKSSHVALGIFLCQIGEAISEPYNTPAVIQSESSSKINASGNKGLAMNSPHNSNLYRDVNPKDMPTLITTSNEENEYILFIVTSAIEVIEGKRNLSENDKNFGQGKYFWPKDPSKPIKTRISYPSENFRINKIFLNFSRKTQNTPWCRAELLLAPKNFPVGAFKMELKEKFFENLIFQDAKHEVRANEQVSEVNVFHYLVKYDLSEIDIKLEARIDLSDIKKRHPSSFHKLILEKRSSSCAE